MTKPLKVAVVGPTGYGGSHTCIELLSRGHQVTGLSRNPDKIGTHPNYTPHSIDMENASITEIIEIFKGHDVIVNAYGPHTAGEDLQFMPYIEIARKIVIAIKHLETPYLVQMGGTGSLLLPSSKFDTACDSVDFWTAYFQGCADNEAYISYADERFPKFGMQLRRYREVRNTPAGDRDEEDVEFLEQMGTFARGMVKGATFIRACRATLQFLDGNRDLAWSFLSPPPGITPGPKVGKVEVGLEGVLPVEGAQEAPWEGRLRGITVKDLAGAIGDEVEGRRMAGRHWTVWTPKEFVFNAPVKSCYGHLDELKGKE